MKIIKFFISLLIIFIFLILYNNSFATVLSDVVRKGLPETFPEYTHHFWYDDGNYNCFIFYYPDDDIYSLFLLNEGSGVLLHRGENDYNDYLSLTGAYEIYFISNDNNWFLNYDSGSRFTAKHMYNIRGHPCDGNYSIDYKYPLSYDDKPKELIYSTIDIKYYDSNDYFFRRTPFFKSVIIQRAVGGYVYQLFMKLAVPLILFIVMLCGFYKSFEFIFDILYEF